MKLDLPDVVVAQLVVGPESGLLLGLEDVGHPAVIEGLAVQPDVRRLVEIQTHTPTGQRRKRLRRPRVARLPVAARLLFEDALHVVIAGALTPREFGCASFPIQQRLILRRRRMLAMGIGVVANGMLLQRCDNVGAVAALERTGLLTDDLECRLNALLGEERRQPFGRVIALRQDVVFRVEPKDDIDLAGCRPQADRDRKSTRLNSSHSQISYAVFCLKKKKTGPSSDC